jgi:hypothetical protein
MVVLPPLPHRDAFCEGLPAPFARPQLDRCAPAFALTPHGPVVSCDAWSDRRLAVLDRGTWHPVTPPGRWHREPRWTGDALTTVAHGRGDDGLDCRIEVVHPTGSGEWKVEDTGVSGRLQSRCFRDPSEFGFMVPSDTVVQDVSVAPDGKRMLVVTRGRDGVEASCVDRRGRIVAVLREPVVGSASWIDPDRVALTISRWPSVSLFMWNVLRATLSTVTPGLGVCESVIAADGQIGWTWNTPGTARHLRLSMVDSLRGGLQREPDTARVVMVDRLPCLVQEPDGEPVGTVVLFHGGPNGVHQATWSAIVESLQVNGWQVVRPNLRGSAVRDTALRQPLPETYGVQDVDDAEAVVRAFGDAGPVVAGGTSYGGYLASRVLSRVSEMTKAFLIGGFLRFADLRASAHPFTRAFLESSRVDTGLDDRPDPRGCYLVIHGERDARTLTESIARTAAELPRARLVVVPGEGHGLSTDAGARYAIPHLFDWLAED